MVGAFLYLFACTFRNRLRMRLRRLRQPRYLIGLIVGVLYFYFVVFRQPGRRGRGAGQPVDRMVAGGALAALTQWVDPLQLCSGLVLFLVTAVSWIAPGGGRPIEFSRAEVQFLFQAPVTRRQLIHYKLLRGQLGAMVGSAVATVFLRPPSFASGWTFLIGLWLLFAVIRLHFIGIALRRQSLVEHRRSGLARNWLPVAIVLGAVGILGGTLALHWAQLAELPTAYLVARELVAVYGQGPAYWVLWPFIAIVKLPLSGTTEGFLRALPAGLLLLGLNYVWVLRGDRAFEEASAADAERRASEKASPRAMRRPSKATPFTLGLTGRPEAAILWKNLIQLGRYATSRSLLRLLPVVIALGIAFGSNRGRAGITALVATISLIAAAMTVLVGPQTMRNDFRQDLANLAVLKSWPIRGSALVRGELLAPTVVLTIVTWILVLFGAVLLPPALQRAMASMPIPLGSAFVMTGAAALLAPGLIAAQLVLQNAIAIVFPAWIAVGPSRPRGIDAMGQRLLMSAGVVVVLVLALLPALLVAGAAGLGLYVVAPAWPALHLLLPAAIAGTVLIAECWLAAEWLGRVFDRTDVNAVEAAE